MHKAIFLLTGLLAAITAQAGELKLELHGAGMAGKQVRVAVYSALTPEQFPSDEHFYRGIVGKAAAEKLAVTISDLPPGRYAVAAYVDDNRNGRQDKNFLGVPKEDYGFSNDVRGRFGPPDFAEAAFDIGDNAVFKTIHLH
ncbi:MAG TPA: DUF2141 domain-containing protein [Sideroxyarcus sp.]|nr:DUF2141 domain-containing protein [Sideroxyarcus sp.]